MLFDSGELALFQLSSLMLTAVNGLIQRAGVSGPVTTQQVSIPADVSSVFCYSVCHCLNFLMPSHFHPCLVIVLHFMVFSTRSIC